MPSLSRGTVLSVNVSRVVDGDTVRVQKSGALSWLFPGADIVVRLYGIDAPESDQKHGSASTKAMRRLLRGRGMRLEVMDKDRYGRTVGLLYKKSDGRERSANLRLVEEGWAFAYTQYGGSELGFKQAEMNALRENRGMWKDEGIRKGEDRPWEYRRRQRQAEERGKRSATAVWVLLAVLSAMLGVGLLWFLYR